MYKQAASETGATSLDWTNERLLVILTSTLGVIDGLSGVEDSSMSKLTTRRR
jgi:hypothetical protein